MDPIAPSPLVHSTMFDPMFLGNRNRLTYHRKEEFKTKAIKIKRKTEILYTLQNNQLS